jgi:hypothetical protein
MASANFRSLPLALANADIDFATGAFKALLVTAVPDETALDTWVDRADVTSEHAASGGYPTGGYAVTAVVSAVDTTNNRVSITFDAADPVDTLTTISSVGLIVYLDTGVAANDLLVSFVDFGGTVASTNGDYTLTFTTPLYINA